MTTAPLSRWIEARDLVDKPQQTFEAQFGDIHVPQDLAHKLSVLAKQSGRTAGELALDLLAQSVEYDQWFRTEVDKARKSAREGRLLAHDQVAARFALRTPR